MIKHTTKINKLQNSKHMKSNNLLFTFIGILAMTITSCSQKPDFKTFPKIDAHCHLETTDHSFVDIVKENDFRLLTLAYDASSRLNVDKQLNYSESLHKEFPQTISFATTFSMEGFGEPGWEEKTINLLKRDFKDGAIAVKVWKDIGMVFRDKDSSFIMIDDKRLDPIWDFIESQNKTVVNHNGEPRNCWLPLDSMTVKGDAGYYAEHPQYHMYLHPEYPNYKELFAARDNMLRKHPNLRYVGCHLGSMEWDVDVQAKWLDEFPNSAMDMADRISHFQIQNSEKVRIFIIKYQDQLLYGTDMLVSDDESNESSVHQIKTTLNNIWKKDWGYFTTNKIVVTDDNPKGYKCLNLPLSVLEKIYYKNAIKMYPELEIK